MAIHFTDGTFQGFTNTGLPNDGGSLESYISGTSTPVVTYTTSACSTANPTTMTLDSAGRFTVWLLSGVTYRFIHKTAGGATIWDKDGFAQADAGNITYTPAGTGAVARTIKAKLDGVVSVRDFGALGDGTTDDIAAFNAAWLHVKTRGGTLLLPPGTYLLSTTWTCDIVGPYNIEIQGRGAEMKAGAAVTGPAIRISAAYNEFLTDVTGLYFNHRGNANVQGCIEVLGGHCVRVSRCTVEMHSVKSGYYFVAFDTLTPGASEDDWNSFWCLVEGCSTRKRSGGESGEITYGIKLTGAVNAFTARNNTLSNCQYGIWAQAAGTTKTLPNAAVIEANSFETLSTAAVHVQMTPGQLGPTGWRLAFNRCETTTSFFSLATGGAVATNHSQPPLLIGNYCTAGSVTNWVLNPTSYPVSTFETRYPGFGPAVNNEVWQSGGMTFRFPTGSDLNLLDASGSTDYNRGKINFGGNYIWVNTSSTKVYVRSGQPTTATDGTVVGTQT